MKVEKRDIAINLIIISGIFLISFFIYQYINVPILSLGVALSLIVYLSKMDMELLTNKKIRALFIIVLIFKFIFLLFAMKVKNIPLAGGDWTYFDEFGSLLANRPILQILNSNYDLFTSITAIFYRVFGDNPNQMYLFNFAVSLITFKYVYKTINYFCQNVNKSMLGSILFFIWPVEIIYSASFLREMTIQMLVIISVYNFVKFIKETRYFNIVGSVITIMLASMMHSGVVGILLIYVFYLAFYKGKGIIKILSLKRIIAFFVAMILIFFTPLADKVLVTLSSINMRKRVVTKIEKRIDNVILVFNKDFEGIEKKIHSKTKNDEDVSDENNIEIVAENLIKKIDQDYKYLKGNTSYVTSNPTNIKEAILQAPHRFINFVFAPFVWQVYDFETILSLLFDGLLQLFIWITMIRWVFFGKDKTKKDLLIKVTFLLMILGTYFVFSWGTYTYGAAIRHRSKLLPIMICVIAISYDWDKLLRKIKVVG